MHLIVKFIEKIEFLKLIEHYIFFIEIFVHTIITFKQILFKWLCQLFILQLGYAIKWFMNTEFFYSNELIMKNEFYKINT